MSTAYGTTPICGHCGRPVLSFGEVRGGAYYHFECARGATETHQYKPMPFIDNQKAFANGRNAGLDEAAKVAGGFYQQTQAMADTPAWSFENARHEAGHTIAAAILALKTTEGET